MINSKNEHSITVEATTSHIAEVRNFVAEQAKICGFTSNQISDIRLAVDEAFTNIIEHAYKNSNHPQIELMLECDNNQLQISLFDSGCSFCEEDYKKPDVKERIRQKKRGGVGVYLIKQLMDDVRYIRHEEYNEIRMIKKR